MNINGKNIILTGASAGIGRDILDLLIRYNDVKIIAVARHIEQIPVIEGKVYPFAMDVSTPEGIDNVFLYAKEVFGNTDIIIANAGFAYLEKLVDPDWKHIQDIFSLNVFSPIYALEKLTADTNSPKAFVCMISGAGLASLPGYSLYCSTKAALHHFIQTYRYEKAKNIQVTAVYPVATRTEFFDKATGEDKTPLPFPQQDSKTVAKKIVKGIEKGRKSVFPSLIFRIFYPLGRAFPIFLKIYSLQERTKVKKWL